MAQSAQLSPQNPWPGLRAFTEGDREFFFGRERETSELFDLVQRASVVVLYGQSGLGKTSLLQAGLLPDLKQVDFLPLRVRFDHGDDAPPLAQQIKNEFSAELDRTKSTTPRPALNETLWEYFHRRDVDFWGPRNRLLTPVIVLDQFEEIFTLGQRNEKSAARVGELRDELEAVLEHRAPQAVRNRLDANPNDAIHYALDRQAVKFVISLREDFLPDLDPWRARMPSLLANRFRLERMTGAQALDVVQRGGRDLLDSGAAHEIVDFVSKSKRERVSLAMEQRNVEPALLSVVCDELNRRRLDRGKSQITVDLLTDEREKIIKNFYDRAFDDVGPCVRDWVEDKLLTASGYRNRAALDDALKAGLPKGAFDQLVNRRILHREERAGVVWLELTHDLLSDPASQSRTAREQRRVTEAAREREAELSAQLKNSRRQVAVYSTLLLVILLLIGAGTALYFVTVRSRQANLEAESARKSYATMATQFNSQSSEIGGTWVATPTLLKMIDDRRQFYDKQPPQGLSSEYLLNHKQTHVTFLTQSSEALYDVGRFEDGLKDAQAALSILDQERWPASSESTVRVMRAEALHNQAAGFLATGQLSKATASYNEALKLVPTSSAKDLNLDSAHIYVLSHFGLGEVELQSLAMASATPHFQAALDFASARAPETDDVHWWKALAFEGLGLSQWDGREAEKWYSKASDEVEWLKVKGKDSRNPRWKRLYSDIAYRWGYSADQLKQYDTGKSLLQKSQAAAVELVTRDPDNLDWQLMLMQAGRGVGQVHYDQGEMESAEGVLEQAGKTAKVLNEGQPTWVRPAVLRSYILSSLGEVQQVKFSQPPEQPAPGQEQASHTDYFDSASKFYNEARDILQRSVKSAPEELAVVNLISSSLWQQGSLRVAAAKASRAAANLDKQLLAKAGEQEMEALAFYMQALDGLHPIESIAKSRIEATSDKAWFQSSIGDVFQDLKQPQKAISAYVESAAAREALTKERPSPENFSQLSAIHTTLGDAYLAAKNFPKASSEYDLAIHEITRALQDQPESTDFLGSSAYIHYRLADLALSKDKNDVNGSLDEMEKAISTDWNALQKNYADATLNTKMNAYRKYLDGIRQKISPESAAGLTTGNASSQAGSSQKADLPPEQAKLLDRIQTLLKNDPMLLLSHYGQLGATLRPLMPGAWRVLSGSELRAAQEQLLAVAKNVKSSQIQGIRKLSLDFYDGADLYEAIVKTAGGKVGIVDYVSRGKQQFLLDGSPDQVSQQLNRVFPLKLDNPSRAAAYLHFWIGARQPEDAGRLEVIDNVDDVDWLPSTPADQRATIAGNVTPLVLEAGSNGHWNAIGSIEVAGELDQGSFNLSRDGTFFNPQPWKQLQPNLPISVDVFEDGIRVQQTLEGLWQDSIKRNPNDETALNRLASRYFAAERYKEAADVTKSFVAYLGRQLKDNPARAKDLQSAYFSLSVAQMFSRDFAGALATTESWKKFASDDIQADRMRDHALLFVGRTNDAETAYLSDVGKTIGTTSWENQIGADFKEFEGKKLIHPDFEHVLGLLDLARVQKQLKGDPTSTAAVQALPQAYYRLKRWQEAIDTEKTWIAFVQRESKDDADRTKALTGAYLNLSWYQLFARDFSGSLASTEAGKKLDPSDLFLDTNRAHALLFLGQTQEAETIYLENRGKKFDPQKDEIWEQAILDDFNSFEKADLTSPEIPRIRKLLSPQSR